MGVGAFLAHWSEGLLWRRDAGGREGIRLCWLSPHPIPLLEERGMQVSYFK